MDQPRDRTDITTDAATERPAQGAAQPATPTAADRAVVSRVDRGERVEVGRLELLEEVPDVRVTRERTGEVLVRREVVTRTETVELELVTETLVISRAAVAADAARAADAVLIDGQPLAPGEEIRVEIYREDADVRKVAAVHQDVRVMKDRVVEHRRLPVELRREEVRVETHGEVEVRDPGAGGGLEPGSSGRA
jgi:uncharacterized protein (TIGR02271 family)